MNRESLFCNGCALIVAGFVFNIIETWYFGWNSKPSCPLEMICDYVCTAAILAGWLILLWMVISND